MSESSEVQEPKLGFPEVLERLGLSRAEVYRQVRDGALAGEKEGRSLVFTEAEVARFEAARAERESSLKGDLDSWLPALADRLAASGDTAPATTSPSSEEESVAEFVQRLIASAYREGASDLHLDPVSAGDRVLFRFAGNLKEVGHIGPALSAEAKSRIRSMAPPPAPDMPPLHESALSIMVGEASVPMRMQVAPTLMGDHLHLHFMGGGEAGGVKALGYTWQQAEQIQKVLSGRPGLLLLAAPGDPDSNRHRMTLAAEINAAGRLVVSMEHRIQRQSELLVQFGVDKPGSPPFDVLARMALDMSPDAVFIDDVRDAAEARFAIEAVGSGSAVIAQVRAPGAVDAIGQVLAMGVSKDALARSLLACIERQAVRRLCPACRQLQALDPDVSRELGLEDIHEVGVAGRCNVCADGFVGRRLLYGIWLTDPTLAQAIRAFEPPGKLLMEWDAGNTLSIASSAKAAVASGEVVVEDVARFLGRPPKPE